MRVAPHPNQYPVSFTSPRRRVGRPYGFKRTWQQRPTVQGQHPRENRLLTRRRKNRGPIESLPSSNLLHEGGTLVKQLDEASVDLQKRCDRWTVATRQRSNNGFNYSLRLCKL